MNLNNLMDAAKAHSNIETDLALSKVLKTSHATLYYWRKGTSFPKPEHAANLAELAGLDPAQVVADLLEQTAQTPALKQVYARFQKLVAAALTMSVYILCKIRCAQVRTISDRPTSHFTTL